MILKFHVIISNNRFEQLPGRQCMDAVPNFQRPLNTASQGFRFVKRWNASSQNFTNSQNQVIFWHRDRGWDSCRIWEQLDCPNPLTHNFEISVRLHTQFIFETCEIVSRFKNCKKPKCASRVEGNIYSPFWVWMGYFIPGIKMHLTTNGRRHTGIGYIYGGLKHKIVGYDSKKSLFLNLGIQSDGGFEVLAQISYCILHNYTAKS